MSLQLPDVLPTDAASLGDEDCASAEGGGRRRWDRQPWFVRVAAIGAIIWMLGLPTMRWGAYQLLHRTQIGQALLCWWLQPGAGAGYDEVARMSCDATICGGGGQPHQSSILDYVLRRETDDLFDVYDIAYDHSVRRR